MNLILEIIKVELIKEAHDCSKGGIAIAASEICMINEIGCHIDIEKIPGEDLEIERILFSESHSRYLLVLEQKNLKELEKLLKKNKATFNLIGKFGGKKIQFTKKEKKVIDLNVENTRKIWLNSLKEIVMQG